MSLRVRVSHPAFIGDLIESLSRGDCLPSQLTYDTCLVWHPYARDDHEARTELGFFLKAWQARHPGVAVDVVG
jgi:hypothetical protein